MSVSSDLVYYLNLKMPMKLGVWPQFSSVLPVCGQVLVVVTMCTNAVDRQEPSGGAAVTHSLEPSGCCLYLP